MVLDSQRDFYERGGPGEIIGTLETTPVDTRDDDPSITTIKRLGQALDQRNVIIRRFDDYYRGKQGRRLIAGKTYRELFTKLFSAYAENFCGVVVDAVEERLDIEGFRFPREGQDPETNDTDAWRIWQDNALDARSQIAHTEALVKSVVYVLVSPFEAERVGDNSPRITIEDPCETIVELVPGTTERLVGLKRWADQASGMQFATLYYPDRIEKWQARQKRWANQYTSGVTGEAVWEHRSVPGEAWPLDNPLRVVPLIPLVNRPRLDGSGDSEIAQIIPIQDAINTVAMNELVASEAAAFPQKWATGIEIPLDPETGKPIEPFKPDIDRIIATKVEGAKFGQFEAANLAQYGDGIDRRVKRIASITRTPYHYFLDHGGQPPSGESLKSSETGLVRKALRKHRQFGEGWEEVMRLAFRSLGDSRADVSAAETKWANPETMTEAEHIDALTKQRQTLHVPLQVLWEEAGYSSVRREAFRQMLEQEREWLNATPVATTQPTAVPGPQSGPQLVITRPDGKTTSIRSMPTDQTA